MYKYNLTEKTYLRMIDRAEVIKLDGDYVVPYAMVDIDFCLLALSKYVAAVVPKDYFWHMPSEVQSCLSESLSFGELANLDLVKVYPIELDKIDEYSEKLDEYVYPFTVLKDDDSVKEFAKHFVITKHNLNYLPVTKLTEYYWCPERRMVYVFRDAQLLGIIAASLN